MTKPIDAAWQSYAAKVLPADAPQVQRVECRRAFYAGAVALFGGVIRNAVADGDHPKPDDLTWLQDVEAELRAFGGSAGSMAELDSAMRGDACLHCRISDLIHTEFQGTSINELLGKLAEVIGDMVAGVGDRRCRRQLLRDVAEEAQRQTTRFREARVAAGAPDFEVRRHRVH